MGGGFLIDSRRGDGKDARRPTLSPSAMTTLVALPPLRYTTHTIMARAKATYGRKPKATPAFAATTGFWSSPNKDSPDAKSAPANAIDDLTTAIENLDVKEREKTERKERKKKEKRDRALQAIDGNAASPVRKLETLKKPCTPNADNKKPAASAHAENPSIAPKTPERVKQLLPKKKAATPTEDQTPQSERRRRRRGKRDIPTIVLDDDGDDDAISASEAASTQPPTTRPRATSTPERPLALPKTTATKSKPSTSSRRRRRSPSVLTTPKPAPDPLTAYTKPLLRLCADRAGRKCPTPFALWSASLEPYFAVHKIAEASYGEVYRLALRAPQPGLGASDESVLKIIALKPPPESRPTGRGKKAEARRETIEGMSSVESVAGEIRLLQRMALVPGFTNFRDVRVLRGAPSGCFVDAWRAWNEGREEEKRSIFPDPGRKGSYDDEQLWAVIEMQDAGTDLENVRMEEVGGVFGVWDVFWSVALALGKGEEEARFEVSTCCRSDRSKPQTDERCSTAICTWATSASVRPTPSAPSQPRPRSPTSPATSASPASRAPSSTTPSRAPR